MKKEKGKKNKYPSEGMNALAKERPDVAKKIMGYKDGGPVEVKADNAVDMVGNPKGKKQFIQIQGWGKARH